MGTKKLIDKVIFPLVGDLEKSGAISEFVRDELWKRLRKVKKKCRKKNKKKKL